MKGKMKITISSILEIDTNWYSQGSDKIKTIVECESEEEEV
jgi:hypothetical protein